MHEYSSLSNRAHGAKGYTPQGDHRCGCGTQQCLRPLGGGPPLPVGHIRSVCYHRRVYAQEC